MQGLENMNVSKAGDTPYRFFRVRSVSGWFCGSLVVCLLPWTLSWAAPPPVLRKPVIVSYYWPVSEGAKTFDRLNMKTPTVIDVLASEGHGSKEVRSHWAKEGKIILNRVAPFRSHKKEESLYSYFEENITGGAGISVDEIQAHKLSDGQMEILIRVFRRLRKEHPEKLIFVWDASRWGVRSKNLLMALNECSDIIMEEIYISEMEARRHGFKRFNEKIRLLDELVPGILEKTILGIGIHKKMDDLDNVDLKSHIEAEIEYIRNDPLLKRLPGIAIYAPVYVSERLQVFLDKLIEAHYLKTDRSSAHVN